MDCTTERVRLNFFELIRRQLSWVSNVPTRATLMTLSLCIALLIVAPSAPAEPEASNEDISALYGADSMISLATGYQRPLFDAPATARLITRAQIDALGAVNLRQILSSVPGIYMLSDDGRDTQHIVRGVTNRWLVLVNGIPLFSGLINSASSLDNILTFDIDYLEWTTGPGSALYGADAVVGTINVVTRTASRAPITEVGFIGGGQDTGSIYFVQNGAVGSADLGVYLAGYHSGNDNQVLEADAQTRFDKRFGTAVSHAPGVLNLNRDVIDSRVDLSWGNWIGRASYRNEFNFGTGVGFARALDPDGTWDQSAKTLELIHRTTPSKQWQVGSYLTLIEVNQPARDLHFYPAGAFGGLFPDGIRQEFDIRERRLRGEVSSEFSGISSHRLFGGVGAFENAWDTLSDIRNYIVRNGAFVPTGRFAEFAGVGDAPLIDDTSSTVYYVFAQDEWRLAPDWSLTVGSRYDHYSQFGGTFNPRVSLVWSATAQTNFKFLYGSAFRPPAILELSSNGTFAPLGNPALKPVTVDMLEFSVAQRFAVGAWSAAVFGFKQANLVETVPYPAAPIRLAYSNRDDEDRGWGSEFTAEFGLTPSLFLQGHYTFQRHIGDAADNTNVAQAPRHQTYAQLRWEPTAGWSVSTRVLAIAGRKRDSNDSRTDPDDYLNVGITLDRRAILERFDVRVNIDNVFDKDIRYPSDSPSVLPYDLPALGRVAQLQLVAHF